MSPRFSSSRSGAYGALHKFCREAEDGFTCKHCGRFVSSAAFLSGVGNRNHCPYCLWSRHLDLYRAGDRLSACKEPMRPIGLTHKRSLKKYASASLGELMLVHHCTGCGHLSINRLAADDDPAFLLAIFAATARLDGNLRAEIASSQIELLDEASRERVEQQLIADIGWSRETIC